MKPDFFLVGAPKCGTTALFQYLCMHPDVCAPAIKEPNYFCEDFSGIRGPRSEAEYLALYAEAEESGRSVGDASVVYMYSDVALKRIAAFNPAAKIIVMLRNPVDMVYSLHSQYLFTLNENVSDFSAAWEMQSARREGRHIPKMCLEPAVLQYEMMGHMSKGIRRVRAFFPDDQIKLLLIDELKEAPQETFDDVLEFLGLAPFMLHDFPVVNANKTNRSKWVAALAQRGLPTVIRRPARRLKKLLGLGGVSVSGKLDQLNKSHHQRSPMGHEMRSSLGQVFADEIAELERLTNRDLSHWRKANDV